MKPSILLVHGLGVSGEYYERYAKILAPHFDVHVIDLPGYGKTPKPLKPLTIPELAEVIVEYIEHSNKRFVTVGQSMGAQIIAHAALKAPQLISQIILVAPTVNNKERTIRKQAFRLFQDTFRESFKVNTIVFTNYARMGLVRFLKTARYMVNDKLEKTLESVRQPVMIVSGSKDKIVPNDWVTTLVKVAPLGSSIEITDAPHLIQYQKPSELAAITKDFISL